LIERQYENVHYLQFSHYSQFPDLIHGVFTRMGGHSPEPYRSLNTSTPPFNPGDSIENVVRNRVLALRALDVAMYPCVTLWQVHGADMAIYNAQGEWRTDWADNSYYERPWTPQSIRKADALITKEHGVVLALSFADCVPITLYDPVEQVIALVHGGWRGTARGIVAATLEAMNEYAGCQPHNIYAGIGPAIGPCCYEVSETVQQLFSGQLQFGTMPTNERYRDLINEAAVFSRLTLPDKRSLRLDLQASNRNQLLLAGVAPEQIETMEICTSCNTDRFFSHRKEQGKTGRFPVLIALS
jgi:YfiH family protein